MTAVAVDMKESIHPDGVRSVVMRALRASPRVYLSRAHAEALFGPGSQLTPISSGLLGEALCLERVTLSGSGKKELRARVCIGPWPESRVALTQQAINALELRNVPHFGGEGSVSVAISGPKGAVVLSGGVCRAALRVLLPEGVAKRLGLGAHELVEVAIPSIPDALEAQVPVEIVPALKEALLVLDGAAADKLPEQGASLTVRLSPSSVAG